MFKKKKFQPNPFPKTKKADQNLSGLLNIADLLD
jgi:hypothetical protein